jgi:hypothetical protein
MRKDPKKEESFGSYLKERRLTHPEGLSIREVSRRAGIDVSYLSRMEKDEVAPPREEVILRLTEVLGIEDSDELLNLANKIPPDLKKIIKEHYQSLPSFLRTARGLSQEDWDRLTRYVKKNFSPRKGERR